MAQPTRTSLHHVLSSIDDPRLMQAFLTDILTPDEKEEIERRWQIVQRLAAGEPQRSIAKDLGIGIATVTRGARELYDKKGGFWRVLNSYQRIKKL